MGNCGRAVGWREDYFFNFPNQAQPAIAAPPPSERSRPKPYGRWRMLCTTQPPKRGSCIITLVCWSNQKVVLTSVELWRRLGIFLWNGSFMLSLWLGRDMLVQERGVYFSLQLLVKYNRMKACNVKTEGAKQVCLMRDACCRKRD